MEKICLAELKKKIKAEKEILNQLIRDDTINRNTQIFVDKTLIEQISDNDYNYYDMNFGIQAAMINITKMTALLNKVTSTTIITCGEFTGSISEAIILLKYLTEMYDRANNMSYMDKSQKLTYDNKLVKTKYFYDADDVAEKQKRMAKAVADLQMAIDKAMFSTEVDIETLRYSDEYIYNIFGA